MLIGHVMQDPEVRYYDHDQAVARISLETTEHGHTLPDGTQAPDRSDWHTILLYRNLAKIAEEHIRKGDRLYVEGKLRYRTYTDHSGQSRRVTEIQADTLEILTYSGVQGVAGSSRQ